MNAAIHVRRADYQGWDACWIEHGPLTLILVPQVGGRIMGKRWRGHDLAFVNAELAGQIEDVANVSDLRSRKRELGLLLWGGDKTWLAPQDRWTEEAPFLDLDSGEYHLDVEEIDADTLVARMQSPVCRETGVQINRTLTVSAAIPGQWKLEHELCNHAAQVVEWAPWDVDMLRRPAQVFLPKRANSAYPDGVKTYPNEGESLTIRDQVVSHHGPLVAVECTAAQRFKFGVDAELGAVLALLDVPGSGLVGYRKHVPTFHPQPYGHGCVAEVFNAARYDYLELELHGPLIKLQPGTSFTLVEQARLFDIPAWPQSPDAIQSYLGINPVKDKDADPSHTLFALTAQRTNRAHSTY